MFESGEAKVPNLGAEEKNSESMAPKAEGEGVDKAVEVPVAAPVPTEPLVVHTMPKTYLPEKTIVGHKLSLVWRWVIIGVLFIGLLAGGAYAFLKFYVKTPQTPTVVETSANNAVAVEAATSTSDIVKLSPAQMVQGQIGELGDVASTVSLNLPEGALISTEGVMSVFGQLVQGGSDPTFELVGGTYTFTPPELNLAKSAELTMTYKENLVVTDAESYLRIGYYAGGAWHSLETQVDTAQNTARTTLNAWKGHIYSLIIPKEVLNTLKPETQLLSQDNIIVSQEIIRGADKDQDGLSDAEEAVYQTGLEEYDSDKDSYNDGLEVGQLYSPISGPNVTLKETDLITKYDNLAGGYSIWYPMAFKLQAPSTTTGDLPVSFISPAGDELFTISAQPNQQNLTAAEWYLKQAEDMAVGQLRQFSVNGVEAVWSVTGKEIYFSHKQKIYILAYNTTDKDKANFTTTFEMLIRGLEFKD